MYVDVSCMGRIEIRNQIHCKIRGGATFAHDTHIASILSITGCLRFSLKMDVEVKTSRSDLSRIIQSLYYALLYSSDSADRGRSSIRVSSDWLNCLGREFIQLSKFV